MPETKFTTNGILVFPELGKDGKVTGPFPSLTVSAKRTVKDVEFTLTVPTAKAAKDNTLNGTTLGLKQNWSEPSVSPSVYDSHLLWHPGRLSLAVHLPLVHIRVSACTALGRFAWREILLHALLPACTKLITSWTGVPFVFRVSAEDFESKAQIDLGTKFKSAGTIYKKKFDSPGRALDLELLWAEKGSQVDVGAVYKLDTQKKVSGK